MENFFENILNYKNTNFPNDSICSQIEKLAKKEAKNGNLKLLKTFLSSIKIYSYKTNQIFLEFNGSSKEKFIIQTYFSQIFKVLIDELSQIKEKNIYIDQINNYIEIIYKFSVQANNWFKFESISRLINILVENEIINLFDRNQISKLLHTLEIKFGYDFHKNSMETDESSVQIELEKACSIWWQCLENLFLSFTEKNLIENLESYQHFYEFCVINCTNESSKVEPYQLISKFLCNLKTNSKGSIYFNIKSSESLKSILNIYKDILINSEHFNIGVLKDFGHQIALIINSDINDNEKILISFETLFEIVLQTKYIKSLKLVSNFDEIKIKAAKNERHYNLNSLFIEKTIECIEFMAKNEHVYKKTDTNDTKYETNPIELFARFSKRLYFDYLTFELKDKSFAKPCIDLIIALLKHLSRFDQCLLLIEQLLSKDDFYLLRNYQYESKLIVSQLFDYAFEINLTNSRNRKPYELLKQTLNNLSYRISPFQTIVDSLQTCLHEKLIFKPIEQLHLLNDNYFLITNDFFKEHVSLKNFTTDLNVLKRLKKCFKIAISDKIFNSIQLNEDSNEMNRAKFFKIFYCKISECLIDRNDIKSSLEKYLIQLVKVIRSKNAFYDEFHNERLTLNFEIVQELSLNLFLSKQLNQCKIVACLIDLWCYLYEEIQVHIIKIKICNIIRMASEKFPDIVCIKSSKLWENFLANKNETYHLFLVQIIHNIFPYVKEEFLSNYWPRFTNLFLLQNESSILDYYTFLTSIVEHAPAYFFQLNKPTGNLVIIDILNKYRFVYQELNILISLLLALNLKLTNNAILLNTDQINTLFNERKKFLRVIFVNGENYEKDPACLTVENISMSSQIRLVFDIYNFLALNSSDNQQVKLLIIDILNVIKCLKWSKETSLFLYLIKNFGEMHESKFLCLLNDFKDDFVEIKNFSNENDVKKAIDMLFNLLDNRSMESLQERITENEKKLGDINQVVLSQKNIIEELTSRLAKQELEIKSLKQNLAHANERLNKMEQSHV